MGQKSQEMRQLIVNDVNAGVKYREIASKYQISIAGIAKIIKKVKTTKTVARKLGSGRKRQTTVQEDRQIFRSARADPTKTCRLIKEELNLNIGIRSVSNRLRERGLKCYFKIKKPLLRKQNIRKRLEFAKKHVNLPLSYWKKVIWTDESKFELKNTKKRDRVYCKSTERLLAKNTQSTVKHGGGGLMVWGCFSWKGVGKIEKIDGHMTGESYVNILKKNLGPSVKKMKMGRYIFQQDNDPKHTSRVAKQYFEGKGMEMLDWPPQSPDLNPIEHLWTELDRLIPMNSRTNLNAFWEGIKDG